MEAPTNRGKLMWVSFLSLIAAGMGFAVRGGILGEWGSQFGFTQLELGTITGGGLIGFGFVIMGASLITDRVGYKPILLFASLLHVLSVVMTLTATPAFEAMGKTAAFNCLFWGMFVFAVANGLCEAVINPLIANLYTEKKTHYLNILHAGWPGGLIVGGLLGALLIGRVLPIGQDGWKIPWEIPLGLYVLPALWFGFIALKEHFPVSAAKKAGLSISTMLAEFASPILLALLLLHACVGYVELGTDSWITNITNSILAGWGLPLFVYTASIMFILRFFAGPIVERINPLGLLCMSSVLGTAGLCLLSVGHSGGIIFIAVTIYGVGKTFLWPTMLGIVGERFPRGGAVTMGAIGGIGMLSAGFLGGPGIGYKQDLNASQHLKTGHPATYARYAIAIEDEKPFLFFSKVGGLDGQKVGVILDDPAAKTLLSDFAIAAAAGKIPDVLVTQKKWWDEVGAANMNVDQAPVKDAKIYGGQIALRWTAVVPAIMFVGYLMLVIVFKFQGGYKTVEIDESGESQMTDHKPTAEEAVEDGEAGPTSGQV